MSKQDLIKYIVSHGYTVLSNTNPNSIKVEEVFTRDGNVFVEKKTIKANLKAVRNWMGY